MDEFVWALQLHTICSTKENDYTVGIEFPNCIIVYGISKNSVNWVFRDNFIL